MENLPEREEMKDEETAHRMSRIWSIVLLIGVLGEEGVDVEPLSLVHKEAEENEEDKKEEIEDQNDNERDEPVPESNIPDDAAKDTEHPSINDDEPLAEEPLQETPVEEPALVHPDPQHAALANPLLKSAVFDEMPPTPRHATPLQLALEELHPSQLDGQYPTLKSPTERKEEAVHPPTEVCDFPVVHGDSSAEGETPGNGIFSQFAF